MEGCPARKVTHFCNITVNGCSAMIEHKSDFYDLTFVLSGSMTYIIDGKTFVLNKNDAVFIPPGVVNSRLRGTVPTHYVSFNFYPADYSVFPFEVLMPNCITADIRKLILAYPQSHLSPYYHAEEKVLCMLNYILFELTDFSAMKTGNEHVMKILHYVENNLNKKLTLFTVSREINLTREYTACIFKKETGKTLMSYINERKMFLAKELVKTMPLQSVAEYLGYDNYNYFSRLFKKHFDVTPVSLKNK